MELEIHNVIKARLAACLHDIEAFFAALASRSSASAATANGHAPAPSSVDAPTSTNAGGAEVIGAVRKNSGNDTDGLDVESNKSSGANSATGLTTSTQNDRDVEMREMEGKDSKSSTAGAGGVIGFDPMDVGYLVSLDCGHNGALEPTEMRHLERYLIDKRKRYA